jgi:teichuronic acid exporter
MSKVIRSLSGTMGTRILSQLVSMGTTIFLARMLKIEDFGLMAMCLIYIDLINNIIDAGFLQAIIQKKKINQNLLSSCFWFLTSIVLICYMLTWFASPMIGWCFREPTLTPLIRAISIVFLFSPIQILASSILIRKLKAEYVGIAELSGLLLKAGSVIYLAFNGYGVWSLVIGYIVMRFFIMLTTSYFSRWLPSFYFCRYDIKEMLSFGLKVTGSRIFWYLYSRIDTIIIGRVIGAEALGLYNISLQLINAALNLFSMVYQRVALPILSRFQDDLKQLNIVFINFVFIAALVAFPMMMGISAASSDIVNALFGPKWANASWLMSTLSCVAALRLVGTLSPVAMTAIGKPELNMYFNLINLALMSLFLYLGTTIWGLKGVVWTWILIYPLFFILVQKVCASVLQISLTYYLKSLAKPVLFGCFIMALAVLCTKSIRIDSVHLRLALTVLTCGIAYLIVLYNKFKHNLSEVLALIKLV